MALQVVHPHQRDIPCQGDRLGGVDPHQQGTGQARTASHRDGRQVIPRHGRALEGLLHGGYDGLEMGSGGHLRHHTAVLAVEVDL